MFGGGRVDDMGGSKRCILMMFFCIIAPILSNPVVSAVVPENDSNGFTLSQENGLLFDSVLFLNGSSTSSLVDFHWDLSSLDRGLPSFDSGKLTSVVAVAENHWDWELEVNVSAYDCTCIVTLFDTAANQHPVSARIVYLGTQNHHPHILPIKSSLNGMPHSGPIFLLSQSTLTIEIPVVIPQSGNQVSFTKLGICPAPSGFCLTEMTDFSNFNFTTYDTKITLEFDRLALDLADGFWLFNITVSDGLLRTSNTEHFRILMDQNLPLVTLSCDAGTTVNDIGSSESLPRVLTVVENTSVSFFVSVDDGYLGGSNILTWTLVLPDGSRRALQSSEQVSDSLITLHPDAPGSWLVELLVRDTAGWLTHSSINLTVVNIAPVVQLELDSFVVLDESVIALSSGENWILNSSKSSDTANDESDLIHTWYVNGELLSTGEMAIDSSDFSETGTYDIVLVVEDDNGESSELSFQVKITDAAEPSTINSMTLLLSAFVLIAIILITLLFVNSSRKQSRETTVPKWIAGNDATGDNQQKE